MKLIGIGLEVAARPDHFVCVSSDPQLDFAERAAAVVLSFRTMNQSGSVTMAMRPN